MSIAVANTRALRTNSFMPVLKAEWIKLRSLRSSKWTLFALVVVTVGLGALITAEAGAHWNHFSAADKRTWDPTNQSLVGAAFGELAVAVFGVLAVTAEYSSGTIRSSVAAVPRRTPLVLAKAVVYGGVSLVVGEVISFASYFLGQALLSGKAPVSHIGDPGVFRAVSMTGGYLALVCLMAIGIGFALRHTAGAIASLVGVLIVLPTVISALPAGVQNAVERFMPEQIAASSTGAVLAEPHFFGPWTGLAMLCLYAALAMGLGAWRFLRQDV
jgi:ABC-2 type transport system permease protein